MFAHARRDLRNHREFGGYVYTVNKVGADDVM